MQQFTVSKNGQISDATVVNTVAKLQTDLPEADDSAIAAHMTLLRAHAVYTAALTARYNSLDLSTGRFNLLKLLYQVDPKRLTVTEVASYLGISVPSTLRMLQLLENEGWLLNKKSESDRRVTYVEFSLEGRERFAALLPPAVAIWEELWSGMTEPEKSMLSHLLAKLRLSVLTRYIGEDGLAAYRSAGLNSELEQESAAE